MQAFKSSVVNLKCNPIQWKSHLFTESYENYHQGYNARKVNCSCVYSAYILKPVLSGPNLYTKIDESVFV